MLSEVNSNMASQTKLVKTWQFSFVITLLFIVDNGVCQCLTAETSEGYVALQEGQRACAPVQSGETQNDKGKRYVTCTHGNSIVQLCPAGLRFDTSTGNCNWPYLSSCQLAGGNTQNSLTTKPVSERPLTTLLPPQTVAPRQVSASPNVGPCNERNCKIPNCSCFGARPSSLPIQDMPMLIMLTFDDHVSTKWYNNYYKSLMVDNIYNLSNPNGNRIKCAFYVNYANTDFTKVNALWEAGHEIGSHTFNHTLPQGDKDSDYPAMAGEIQGIKDEILKATGNKALVDSVIGFRAPYLRVAGDVMYDVLRDNDFLYDTSILNINNLQGKAPHFPYTFDFLVGECISPPCPTKSYPGLWEIPLNGWIGDDGQGCSMADSCVVGNSSWLATDQQWYDYYKRNFETYFYPGKVPMPIFIHGTMFDNYPRSYNALILFMQDTLRTRNDVWFVSPRQVIKWMQNPISNSDMIAQKWN